MDADNLSADDLAAKYPSTRSAAREAGSVFYFTRRPCPKEHVAPRYVSTKACQLCLAGWHSKAWEKRKTVPPEVRSDYRKKTSKTYRSKIRDKKPWFLMLRRAESRAKQKGMDYSLTAAWAQARWTGRCELTGIPFDLFKSRKEGMSRCPSLDRIDNLLGYTKENTRFILYSLNAFKSNTSEEEMLFIARALVARTQ